MKSPITNEILNIIRTYAYREDMTISEFGRRAGVSKAWLSKLKNTDANLSLATAERLLKAAGYKLTVLKDKSASVETKIEKTATKKVANRIFKKMLEADNS